MPGERAIVVRRAEIADAPAIAKTFAASSAYAETLQLPFPSTSAWQKRVSEIGSDDYVLVAEIDGEVVGNAGLHPVSKSPRRRHAGTIGMAVRDDWHGRGVGTALMAAIVDLADNWLGYRRLELTVYTDNVAAVALYRKFGFEMEGTLREYSYRDGEYVDAYTMARLRTATDTKEVRRKLTKTQRKRS